MCDNTYLITIAFSYLPLYPGAGALGEVSVRKLLGLQLTQTLCLGAGALGYVGVRKLSGLQLTQTLCPGALG